MWHFGTFGEVDASTWFPLLVSPFVVVHAYLSWRFVRKVRASEHEDWTKRWRSLDKQRQKRIRRAMRTGKALDPEDVELAQRAEARRLFVVAAIRPTRTAGILTMAAFAIAGILAANWGLVIVGVLAIAVDPLLSRLSRARARSYHRSIKATQRTTDAI
jgi:membrane protein implicated in regulation of membrane protease activity